MVRGEGGTGQGLHAARARSGASGSLSAPGLQEGRTINDRQHQAAQRKERRAQRAEQVELLRTRAGQVQL